MRGKLGECKGKGGLCPIRLTQETKMNKPNLGRCLKIAQVKYDMNTARLAEKLMISPQVAARLRIMPDMKYYTILRICDVFKMEPSEFINLEVRSKPQ